MASIGYFFYKYTRRAKIYCSLVHDGRQNQGGIKDSKVTTKALKVKKAGLLRNMYRKTQSLWDPVTFSAVILIASIFDLLYLVVIFYGITYPIHFVISYIYQARIGDIWVYEWLRK